MSIRGYRLRIFFLIMFVSLYSMMSFSSSGEAESEGAKESKASSQLSRKPREQKNFDEWLELSGKLEKFLTRIRAKRQVVEGLIAEKNKEQDPTKLAKIADDLGVAHREYLAMTDEYEKLRNYILYRFPERANEQKRIYKKLDGESITEIESRGTIEGKIKTIVRKVKKQYPSSASTSEADDKVINSESDKKSENSPFKDRDGVTGSVIINK